MTTYRCTPCVSTGSRDLLPNEDTVTDSSDISIDVNDDAAADGDDEKKSEADSEFVFGWGEERVDASSGSEKSDGDQASDDGFFSA